MINNTFTGGILIKLFLYLRGKVLLLIQNKSHSSIGRDITTIAIVLFSITFSSAETPKVALGTGWECNISNISYAMGPAIQIGFAWPKQYIGGSYQWCLMSNRNSLSEDEMYHHGGGITYYFSLLKKKYYSCAIGALAGFWEQNWNRFGMISNDNGDFGYLFLYTYRFFGGPKAKIQIGINHLYLVFQYTLFLGKVDRHEIMYDEHTDIDVYDRHILNFSTRSSINCMIWIEL